MLGDPAAGGELADQGAIQLAPAVVEILETGLTHFEFGFFEAAAQGPILARELLGIDEHAERSSKLSDAAAGSRCWAR